MYVTDIADPFIPFPKESLKLNVIEDRERIDNFLDKLYTMHTEDSKKNLPGANCMGAAIDAAI